MTTRLIICCCLLASVTRGQAPWSLQSLRTLTQYDDLTTALSSNGDVYIAGGPTGWHWPQPWPPPTNSIGDISSEETLVSKIDGAGNPLYVTAIGGAGVSGLALDPAGNLYVYGAANTKAFATTPGAFNAGTNIETGDFVCKLRAGDGSILFCSLFPFGVGALTVDSMGNVYVAGGGSAPTAGPTPGALALGTRAVQVTKLNTVGAIIYRAEFSGPQGYGSAKSIAADAQGNVWVAGSASPDFPTTPNALLPTAPATSAGSWGFLAGLNSSGTALLYSTFTDGSGFSPQIALDGAGNIYETDSTVAGAAIWK